MSLLRHRVPCAVVATVMLALAAAAVPAAAAEDTPGPVLEEVVVTATRTSLPIDESPQVLRVIDREDLESAGGSVVDALERLPAFRGNRAGTPAMAALPTLRGSLPGEVLVLQDGRRLNNRQSGWFNLSDLPVPGLLVERVEVLEDASSALWGADASGGVINVITRDPMTLPSGAVRLTAGSFGTRGGEGFLSARVPGGGLAADAAHRTSDGFRPNTDARESRYGLRYSVPGDDWAASVSVDVLRKELGSPGPTAFPTPRARQEDALDAWGAAWEYEGPSGLSLAVDVLHDRARREYRDADWETRSVHRTETSGFGLRATWLTGPLGRLTAGVEGLRDEVDSTNDGRHHLTQGAVFLQDEVRLGRRLLAVLGARWDDYSGFDDQFSPRLALVADLGEGVRARGSVARGYRVPTFDDLYWDDPYARGNPGLGPERAWSWEVGLAGSGWGASWDLYLFRRDVDDLIVWLDRDGDWVYSPENLASARVDGVTASWRVPLPRGSSLGLAWTRLVPADRDLGEPIPGRPEQLVKADLRAALPWGGVVLDAAASWTRLTAAPNLADRAYRVTSLQLSRAWTTRHPNRVVVRMEAENLEDLDYEVVPGYPMPGRNFTVGVDWTF